MSVAAGVVVWYGEKPDNLAVQVLVDAPAQSVSEIYIEVTFAEDQERGHDTVELVASTLWFSSISKRIRVTRRYQGQIGSKPHLEVKVTSGESAYDVRVLAGTGPQGIQLDPFTPMTGANGTTGQTIIIDPVEAQST